MPYTLYTNSVLSVFLLQITQHVTCNRLRKGVTCTGIQVTCHRYYRRLTHIKGTHSIYMYYTLYASALSGIDIVFHIHTMHFCVYVYLTRKYVHLSS